MATATNIRQQAAIDACTRSLADGGVDAVFQRPPAAGQGVRVYVTSAAVQPRLFSRAGVRAPSGPESNKAVFRVLLAAAVLAADLGYGGVESLASGDLLTVPGASVNQTGATAVLRVTGGIKCVEGMFWQGEAVL